MKCVRVCTAVYLSSEHTLNSTDKQSNACLWYLDKTYMTSETVLYCMHSHHITIKALSETMQIVEIIFGK